MGEAKPSASSYPETMNPPSKDREPNLHLPPGYHAHLEPEVLILRREDGSQVALFSIRGFVAEAVEQVAWEDHDEAEWSSRSCASSSRLRRRALPWPPRPPG